MPGSASPLDYFGLRQHGADPRTEVRAGVATFMVMSYIIFVNPSILGFAGISGLEGKADGLTDLGALAGVHRNWRSMLRHGLEAGDLTPEEEAAIESRQRTGRPWGSDAFVAGLEAATGRTLARQKPGPKRMEK